MRHVSLKEKALHVCRHFCTGPDANGPSVNFHVICTWAIGHACVPLLGKCKIVRIVITGAGECM